MYKRFLIFLIATILLLTTPIFACPISPEESQFIKISVPVTPEIPNIQIIKVSAISVETEIKVEDRTVARYEVYKNKYKVTVAIELQWYIYDISEEYNIPEKLIYGLILNESCFKANTLGDKGRSYGLCQIQKYWITKADIPRLTDDWKDRDLLDPYDNLITFVELWNYARDKYSLDLDTKTGMVQILYWHGTGKDPRKITQWNRADKIFGFMDELVELT